MLSAVLALSGAGAAGLAATGTTRAALPPITIPGLPGQPPPVVAPPAPGPATVDYGYDAAHDFAAADSSIAPPLGSLWSISLNGDPIQLLAADKLVFALVARPKAAHTTGTYLLALDPSTGKQSWNLLVPNGSQIAYASGVVAVAGGDHIQAFKAATGANVWNVALAGVAAITPADGQLYANAAGGAQTSQAIASIAIGSGKVTWSAKPPSPEGAGPLGVAGGRVYRSEGNQAQAYNRLTGKLLWQISGSGAATGAGTATLWQQRIFRSPFPSTATNPGAPATTVNGPPLLASNGVGVGGDAAAIVSGDTGLLQTAQGVIANDVATGTYIWSAYTHPLAALNDQAVTWGKNAIELRSLASGKLTWWAQMTGTPGSIVTAVGNGELLVGTGGHLTALVAYPNSAVPKVTVKIAKPYSTFGGPPAAIAGSLSQPGIEQSYGFTVAGRPAGSKSFGHAHAAHTKADGTLALSERPQLDTVYRISLPGSSVALSLFEIVALPRITYKFGRAVGAHGAVTVTLAVPDQVHLAHHHVSLYIGRAASKRYLLLGTGRLTGHSGHFAGSFKFKLEQHVGKKDFVTACFAGLYRQGMSYGDRLDRRCGAAQIKF